jgi:hypothetical protein
MLVLGGRDPFFDGEASLERWAAAFTGNCELFYVPRLPHVVPSDAESVARMMDFVRSPGD